MTKNEYLDQKISHVINTYPELSEIALYTKNYYQNDDRSIEDIDKEINNLLDKYQAMESLINKDINPEVLDKSVLLIGPMGVGKSSVAENISRSYNVERISLDAEDKLETYYKNRDKFNNFKDFEFYLTASVLTNLEEPKIIDFGAGHSIYENPLTFMEFKKLMGKFKNVILLMPTENKEESLDVIKNRRNFNEYQLRDNKHFIESPCNYEVAKIIEYTDGKNIKEVSEEIINKINNNKNIGL